MSFLVSDI